MVNKIEVKNRLIEAADNLKKKYPWLTKSMLVAQVLLESGWLKHSPGNNCLGIKWTSKYPESRRQWLDTKEEINGKLVWVKAPFVIFDSIEQCIEEGYIRILLLNRYKETREAENFWESCIAVKRNGYATSSVYANSLHSMIIREKLYMIDWTKNPNDNITDNFKWEEIYSSVRLGLITYKRIIEPPKRLQENCINLAKELQKIRTYTGMAMVINSWYRIPEYNGLVGGVSNSQHLLCKAADVRNIRNYPAYKLEPFIKEKTNITGLGIGRTYNHFDIKDVNYFRKWYY